MKQYNIILAFLCSTTVVVLSHELVLQTPNNLRGGGLDANYSTLVDIDDASFAIGSSDEDSIIGNNHDDGHQDLDVGEDLCLDVLQTCTSNCVTRSGGSKTRAQCRVQCKARMIQTCTTNCVKRSGGSETRAQCQMSCTRRYRSGSGSESTGPGKHFTIAPTPTPPSRGRVICIQKCISNGGSAETQRLCKAKCPVPEFDWEIC